MNRERTEARMSDREALAAALAVYEGELGKSRVLTAARERLAQLPEKCDLCEGGAIQIEHPCPICYGSGRDYPRNLVALIARVIAANPDYVQRFEREKAVAVLDALNGETE